MASVMRGGFVRDDATRGLVVSFASVFAGADVVYRFDDLGNLTAHPYGGAALTQNADSVSLSGTGISAGVGLALPADDSVRWAGGPFTFAALVTPSELPASGEWRFIAMAGNSAENNWFGLRNEGGVMHLEAKVVGLTFSDDGTAATALGGNRLLVPYTPVVDTPVAVAWRFDDGRLDVFVDGVKQAAHGTYTGTPTPSVGDDSTIASYNSGGSYSYGFHGDLDEVAYFFSAPSDERAANWTPPAAPPAYPAAVQADSPLAYYRLADASAEVGTDGTVVGTVTFGQAGATSDGDTAALFDGTTGYINLGDLSAAEDKIFTYECWFKDTGGVADKWMVAEGRTTGANPTVGLIYQGGQVRGWFRTDGGTPLNLLSPLSSYNDGLWHHAALTGDGTTMRLYVDGAEVINGTIPAGAITLDTTTLGASKRNTVVSFYDGTLDEAAIYDTALSPARIMAHYDAAGPVAHAGAVGLATSGTDVVINQPAGLAAGDLMVAAIVDRGASGDTITPPAGWTVVREQARGSVGKLSVFSKVATGSEPATYTFVCSSSNTQVGAILAVANATAVDASASATDTVATGLHSCPDVTATVGNALALRIAASAVGTLPCSWTWPAGTTEVVDASSVGVGAGGLAIALEPVAAAGAVGARVATFAQSSSTTYATATVVLK